MIIWRVHRDTDLIFKFGYIDRSIGLSTIFLPAVTRRVMSQAQGLDDPQISVKPPVCPDCMKPMRFVTSNPDKQHSSIQHFLFMCDCGRTSDQIIAKI